ncbi:cytochrome c biogenesis protein ResB [Desulforhopalus vacuolatus]|uniref:cytochrome c biogenesis protein ResB n=1 Tax=Desulforhopalus vacuolatus TaxID=40414 RepID=UPI001963DBB2|nr:cytochrome c biogenesis protein ResB [Desulforhopalus vacuolatus]MBM9519571.1 cytochrome c biogenesis protein ResB [Desulforhopalus vacuolatus]
MKKNNPVWHFFSSVHLALTTLIALAITSVIGTLIPQGEAPDYYYRFFGNSIASFFSGPGHNEFINKFAESATTFTRILDLDDMYSSWWYLSLLSILALNLIVCTLDRFPLTWRLIHQDNFKLHSDRIAAKQGAVHFKTSVHFDTTVKILNKHGWKGEVRREEERTIFFAQKGRWGRLGVYIVHISILVIFSGAFIGWLGGFKATVWVPELESVHTAYTQKGNFPLQLPYDIHCNYFDIKYYNNGMAKEYESSISLVQDQKELTTQMIEVNGPLKYEGTTFYQASYQPVPNSFVITFSQDVENTGKKKTITEHFIADYQQPIHWNGMSFGILRVLRFQNKVKQEKFWFKTGDADPWEGWLDNNVPTTVTVDGKVFKITVKQRFSTGLQVAKDPGVPLVYLGCLMMLAGLYMAFFMSHRRIWLLQDNTDKKKFLVLAGSASKNKIPFTDELKNLVEKIQAQTR